MKRSRKQKRAAAPGDAACEVQVPEEVPADISGSQQDEEPQPAASAAAAPAASEVRFEPRVSTQLQSIVQVKEGLDNAWKEVTDVSTVSKNGAGFHLSRPCSVGRLVTIVMPMPKELRAYDYFEPLYPVMGLVQYCNAGKLNGTECYHVGVAFIGKQVPESFRSDPTQSYRIVGMTEEGLWSIVEVDSQFKARRGPRLWVTLDVSITILHNERKAIYKDQAQTQNIGARGASIFSDLEANIGDKVKFSYKELDYYTVAVVRDRRENPGTTNTLHLEFLDSEFPLERLRALRREQKLTDESALGDVAPPPPIIGEVPPPDRQPPMVEFERY